MMVRMEYMCVVGVRRSQSKCYGLTVQGVDWKRISSKPWVSVGVSPISQFLS